MKYRLFSLFAVLVAATLLFTACGEKECPSTKAFSIGNGHYVEFSPGNLRYTADTNRPRYTFAAHQYDICGMGNQSISDIYSGWIDLFGWGTGKTPTLCSVSDSDYVDFNDWGDNTIDVSDTSIFHGAVASTGWRTLTFEEWDYLLNQRPNAAALRGTAIVHGVNGLLLLPDKWTGDPIRGAMARYSDNDLTEISKADSVWNAWEKMGAIFLPAAGQREGKKVSGSTQYGRYWTSTPTFFHNAYLVGFMNADEAYNQRRSLGRSVRLVKDVQ